MYKKEGVRPFFGANSYIIPAKNALVVANFAIVIKDYLTTDKLVVNCDDLVATTQ